MKTNVVTHHKKRLDETVLMMGHKICLKPQSHQTKFLLRQCKFGLTQYKLVQCRRNAVETNKDVTRSLWSWLTWVNFEHVQKNRSEPLSEQGRSKDSVETWKQRH